MALIAKAGNEGGFTPIPPGMHLARCYRVIDLGTQKSEYQGQIKYLRKVMLQFEVHSEGDDGQPLLTSKGEPMTISKNYTLSLAEKASLRADLQSWRGRDFTADELQGFELKNILGAWAMITVAKSVGNNGKEYTNIMNVNPVPPAIKKSGLPTAYNQPGIFSLDDVDMEMFETFSTFTKQKIQASPEWQNRSATPSKSSLEDIDEDIPF